MFGWRVAALLALATGCSYLQIDRAPRAVRRGDVAPGCTTSLTYPAIDATAAVLGVVGGVGIFTGVIRATKTDASGMTVHEDLTGGEKAVFGSAAIAEGLLFLWSGLYGYRTANQCREMQKGPP